MFEISLPDCRSTQNLLLFRVFTSDSPCKYVDKQGILSICGNTGRKVFNWKYFIFWVWLFVLLVMFGTKQNWTLHKCKS
ncbi:Hypothetical protein PP7435_CHR2-1803 [Komagataella phaffii CBS 7435]|uniref:Uncharacterized protein n=1 Tax=Komagataella phaffii (strain ATCC 76273 / CBS 7435 / CECT 11047 / NRRL Y-11430 / Wegner 21-1) TaxID=981350 RepID=A0A1G4KPV0_KOMPC|nr:Hypothetical protein BQ9382_C2-2093 [Komagataella phaffii CBS 7435]SCV12010.1 Hypothetical protein PP7435_CHR2-1803 [Komagataella phaffii CBS 7435]